MYHPDKQYLIRFSTWKLCQVYTPATQIAVTLPHNSGWNSSPKHEAFMLFPWQEGLVMQAQPLMQVCLSLQQTHQVPLLWIQEESKQRKPVSFFIAWSSFQPTQNPSLQTVHVAVLTGLPRLTCLSVPSLGAFSCLWVQNPHVVFLNHSFLVFSPACPFPAFQKVNCWPNPPSTLFKFLTSHTQAFMFSNDMFVLVEEFYGVFTQFLKEPMKQAEFSETLCKLQPSKPSWLFEMLVETCFHDSKSKIKFSKWRNPAIPHYFFVINARHSLKKKMGRNTSIRNPSWQASPRSPSDFLNFMEKNLGQRL